MPTIHLNRIASTSPRDKGVVQVEVDIIRARVDAVVAKEISTVDKLIKISTLIITITNHMEVKTITRQTMHITKTSLP